MTMSELTTVRLDKWLWAARFYKTRSLAAAAIDGGKIEVNGDKAKRAKDVRAGDVVRVRLGLYEHIVTVRGVALRRGSATVAHELYEETPASVQARTLKHEQLALLPSAFSPAAGKPSKKERRARERFRNQ
jgi:ribosome-associated heat shock protein Hsp15